MKQYKNLIASFLSLLFTTFLLAFTIYGWYTSNKLVSTSGVSGAVADSQLINSVEYYNFSSKDGSTLTIGQSGTSGINMVKYNELSTTPTEFLIKINLTSNVNVSRINIVSNASYFIGYPNDDNPGYITSTENLSLSSVIEFAYLETATITNNTTVTYTAPNDTYNFTYNASTGAIITSSLDLIDSSIETDTIYLLLNYNSDALADFYGNNIGNSVLEEAEEVGEEDGGGVSFVFDFKIIVI